jgi:rRNA-processing protein FCF1
VLLDSNILIHSIRFKLNLLEEVQRLISRHVEFYVLPQVVEELSTIVDRGKSGSKEAKLILQHLNGLKPLDFHHPGRVDELILQAAKKWGMAVATADVTLKKRLREMKVPVITLRGRRLYLQPEDPEFWSI